MSSKDKIVLVALDQFYRKGYQASSVDDIIEEAGVSKSNFYYHFKSKEDLGVTVLEVRNEEFRGLLKDTLCNCSMDPRTRLVTFLNCILQSQEARLEKGGCPFGNLVAEMAEHSERLRCQLSSMFGGLTVQFTNLVEEGQELGMFRRDIDAGTLGLLMVNSFQGMLLMTKCYRSMENTARGMQALVKMIESDEKKEEPHTKIYLV